MSDLKICRICLCKDVKLYNHNQFNLQQYFEEVMAQRLIEDLPQYFCYTCATLLYKFHKFKQKILTGQHILKVLLWNKPVTPAALTQLDKICTKLEPYLDVMTIGKRVKTYSVVRTSKTRTSTEENNFSDREPGFESSDDEDIIRLEQINIDEHKNIEIFDKVEDKEVKVDSKDKNEPEVIKEKGIKEEKKSQNDKKKDEVKPTRKRKRGPNKTKPKAAKSTKISMKIETNKFRPKTKHLNPEHWLKITLSEEEAMEKFKARATDRKYLSAAFQCHKCYKGFSTEDIYTRHMKLAHDESRGAHECRFCGIRFKHHHAIRRHMLVHYHRFQCLRCKLVFLLEGSAHIHNDVHSGIERVCERCGMKFKHSTTFYTHMRIYHRSEHVCTVCGVSFVSDHGLRLHKRVKHLAEVEPPAEGENTYCVRCDIKFETKQAYDEHFRESVKHADDDLALDGETDPEKSNMQALLKDKVKKPSRPRKCATNCFVCEKAFESYTQYRKHHQAEHKDIPMRVGFKICEICGANVKNGSIGQHMNRHTKLKVYPCPLCGVTFNTKSNCNRHQLSHTGEKPFPCPSCEKRFAQKDSMQIHYRTIHLKEPYPKRNKRKKTENQDAPSFANLNPSYGDNNFKSQNWG